MKCYDCKLAGDDLCRLVSKEQLEKLQRFFKHALNIPEDLTACSVQVMRQVSFHLSALPSVLAYCAAVWGLPCPTRSDAAECYPAESADDLSWLAAVIGLCSG